MGQPASSISAMNRRVVCLLAILVGVASADDLHYFLSEETPIGTRIADLSEDVSMVATLTPSQREQLTFNFIVPSDGSTPLFEVDARSGIIFQVEQVDREAICSGLSDCVLQRTIITLPAQMFSYMSVYIHIEDVNDNAPVFPESLMVVDLGIHAYIGRIIQLPIAVDQDVGVNSIAGYRIMIYIYIYIYISAYISIINWRQIFGHIPMKSMTYLSRLF